MKIDFIIGSLNSGGAERVVSTLANYLVSNGHSVRVITFRGGDKYNLDKRIKRLKLHKKLPFLNYTLLRAFLNLLKLYFNKKNRPDIISAHIGLMGLPTIPIAKLYKIKIVISEHINHTKTTVNFQRKILWNYFYKQADAITVLTSYDLPFFRTKNSNVWIMHNPSSFVSENNFNTDREKTIVAIGNLDRYIHKGFDNLIDIAYKITKDFPNWKFNIIGEGEKGKTFLQQKIENLHLNNVVTLLGYRSDIDVILKNSSIFILSSRYEGLPMALIEACSQGAACIAYDCISGPSDIIQHGMNGLLIEDQNQKEMIRNISRLIKDEKLRNSLGANAINSVEKFSTHKIGLKWEKLFHSIS